MGKFFFIVTLILMTHKSYGSELFFTTKEASQLQLKAQNPLAPYLFVNQKALSFNFSPQDLKEKQTIRFELTDGFIITAKKLSLQKSITGDFIWLGRVQGDPNSYVSFVINDQFIYGEISAGGKTYRLSRDQQRQPYMKQMVLNKGNPFHGLDDSIPVPRQPNTKDIISTTSTDNFVDVILATATEAAANSGATATMEAMLSATNLMLADSCINFRYRLLSVENTVYSSGSKDHTTVLTDLTGNPFTATPPHTDLQALHTTRDTSGADLVQIFVDTSNIGVCGLAWRGDFGYMRDEYGFSLVLYGCPASTMAHEFGHNLTLYHDRYQHDEDLTDSSASGGEHYGFVDTINGYESVMSYNDHCDENGISCDRIGKFSNPRISHNGVPFGLDGFADAADALNRAFPYAANYRTSQSSYDPGISENCSSSAENKDIHCFIATATYGSYLHPQIKVLRNFRDQVLKKTLLGKIFVKFYYKVSPYLVPHITTYPLLKKVSLIYIESLIFILQYSWLFILLLITLLFRVKRYGPLVIIFTLFSQNSEALYSMNPFFRNLSPKNPSLILDSQSYFTLSPNYNLITSKSEPNSVTTVKESGNFLNVFTGYGDSSFGITANYTPSWEKKIETATTPFSTFETTEETSNLEVGMAFDLFDYLPIIGVSYSSQTFLSKNSSQQEQIDKKTDSINIGSRLNFGMVQMGGGLIYSQENGEDNSNSTDLPDAKWISAYLAFAFAFDFSGAASGSFDSNSFGKDGFQMEVFYVRDPEVVEVNGVASIVYPATASYGAFGQWTYPFGVSKMLLAFELLSKNQSSIELFNPESTSSLKISTLVGYQTGSWLFSAHTYNLTQDSGYQKSEFGAYLGIAYLFSGPGGDYSTSFGGSSF